MPMGEYRPAGRDFIDLVSANAWEHLGMTGQQFLAAWYRRAFEGDERPVVVALDRLLRTGVWQR